MFMLIFHFCLRKKKDKSNDDSCKEQSEIELKQLLGPAFNGRYMSVEEPLEEKPMVDQTTQSPGTTLIVWLVLV